MTESPYLVFTKEMRKTHTILAPNMAPIHFALIQEVFVGHGYNLEVLNNDGSGVVSEGLSAVHNDICYPALLVIGQIIDALKSGKYDLERTAVMITQTGGGCRASNYIFLLRKALRDAGYEIPVISLNLSGFERGTGFSLTFTMLRQLFAALCYGDTLMLLHNRVRAYELIIGDSQALLNECIREIGQTLRLGGGYRNGELRTVLGDVASRFAAIPIKLTDKIKVGIVGEIYVKFSPLGNNGLEEFLHKQDCEVCVPGMLGFLMFKTDNRSEDIKLYGGSMLKDTVVRMLMGYLAMIENAIIDAVSAYPQFIPPSPFKRVKQLVDGVIGYGSKMGEGWLLTAEMLELIESGYKNIVCTQPFGCLPNHIVGKGMIRKIKQLHPEANIVPIDYDPGATRVNQENRIKLMLSVSTS